MLSVQLLGELQVVFDGEKLPLPSSRKTRALLGYLILSSLPQRRERLCELFWEVPDDPRGALRWSLSKLRGVVNRGGVMRLDGNRETIQLKLDDAAIDLHRVRGCSTDEGATIDDLASAWQSANQPLMEDCDLPNQEIFAAWLQSQRNEIIGIRTGLARRLTQSDEIRPEEALVWADRWRGDAPFDRDAAERAVAIRRLLGREAEASLLAAKLDRSFRDAGVEPPIWRLPYSVPAADRKRHVKGSENDSLRRSQTIRFVKAQDGTRLSWATIGSKDNPPLVKAANWLSHLELDWDAPIWSPLFRDLARDRCLIRYDERGCGLSDWEVPEISFETFVTDLELVVDAAGLKRFPLLGISQGAAVSIEYAARHPERVSHLILFGAYAAGWRYTATPEEAREREAVMVLVEAGWGRSNPSYRHMFSRTFMPDADPKELEWFDEFQRRTASASNAVRFLQAFAEIDIRARLASLKVPTLVIHSRGDMRIPLETGWEIAAAIPNAQFVGLESNNHLLLGREPAAAEFLTAVRDFLKS